MAKRANLNAALDDVTPPPATPSAPVRTETIKAAPIPSREGTALIGAHLPARYAKAMKLLSATTGQTQRELFEEALNMLFVKKGAKELGLDV
jgi:hypothetical protein